MTSLSKWPALGFKPPISILGVRFDNLTIADTLALIEQMIASRRPHYVVTANVDFVVQAQADIELRRIFFDAHLVLCDGTPLVWASRMLGNRLQERVAGADIVPLLIQRAEEKAFRIFFLGAAPESIERAVANVRSCHPNLIVCGFYSPPFNQLLEMNHEEIRKRILEAQPDLLLVSLGCPKQEKWVAMNYRSLRVPVTIGVGATIDFLAGQMKRAPLWMQRNGLEWIFRLCQEPRRLYRRYSKDIWVFGRRIASQLWHLRPRQASLTDLLRGQLHELSRPDADCFLDLSQVQFIDSIGIAALMSLHQQLAGEGRHLVLIAPSPTVRRALSFSRLEPFFLCADDLDEARELILDRAHESEESVELAGSGAFRALVWHGEITAVNVDDVWERTRAYIEQARKTLDARPWTPDGPLTCHLTPVTSPGPGPSTLDPQTSTLDPLVIDLSVVRFIDSSGLGLMIRIKRFARQAGIPVRFTNLQPAVLNVIQIARLEEFLLDAKPRKLPLLSQYRQPSSQKPESKAEPAVADK